MKGFWRTVESVAAVILVMSFLLILGATYFSVNIEKDMSSVGYESLRELDRSGQLRADAVSGDYDSIESGIEIRGFNHSVEICGYEGNCTGDYPDAGNVIVSSYIISGQDSYRPMEIRLYMWR
jgi:hypothetical protein